MATSNPIDIPPELPPQFRSGDPVIADHIKRLRQAIIRLSGAARPASQIFPKRKFPVRLIVKEVGGDWLRCHTKFVGEEEGLSEIYVAKPYKLQLTPFDTVSYDGITYAYTDGTERVATDDETDEEETQIIVPAYTVDLDIIYADIPHGGTGVEDPVYTNRTVYLMDVNRDARAWAKKSGG